ncbi:MAG TPA: hypothetical protein VGD14_09405 [bacterium]
MGKPIAVFGIDPGVKGALVAISESDLIKHSFKDTDNAETAVKILCEQFSVKLAILEKVWFRPNERDVKSVEVLIRNMEMWHTLLHVFKIDHLLCSPAEWRKGLIGSVNGDKKQYVEKAKVLMPHHAHMFTRHDVAEAGLMAWRAWHHVKAGWPTGVTL